MANKAEAHRDSFNEKQLRAVDMIVDATGSVDFDKAVEIGLITEETRDKTEKVLGPDHARLLLETRDRILGGKSPAIEKAKTPESKNRVALRLAFERVCGKLLLEEEYKDTDPQHGLAHEFEHKLGHVLKHKISEESGVKGRSELVAARRRLMLFSASTESDPAKNAALEAQRKEIQKLQKLVAGLERAQNATDFSYSTLFKILPAFVKLIIANREAIGDDDFVGKCENYGLAFRTVLTGTGLTQKSKKAEVDLTRPEFIGFKTRTFDAFASEVVAFVAGKLPTIKSDVAEKEKSLSKARISSGIDILDEAFTIEKALTPEEKARKFEEAKSAVDALKIPNPDPSDRVKNKIGKIKSVLGNIDDKKSLERAVVMLREVRSFLDKDDQGKVDKIIGNLESVAGIRENVAVERAEARLTEANANVEKAKKAREYFSTNNTSRIQTAAEELLAQTAETSEGPDPNDATKTVTTSTTKEVIDPKDPNKKLKYDTLAIRPTIGGLQAQLDRLSKGGKGADVKSGAQESARIKTDITALTDLQKAAQKTYDLLLAFTENVVFLAKNDMLGDLYDTTKISDIHKRLQSMNPESSNVSAKKLHDLYEELKSGDWFKIYESNLRDSFAGKIADLNENARHAERDLTKKKESLHAIHDLSDTEAAKRIILTIVKRQHPELSLEEQDGLANLILADDVEKIQTSKGYKELANEGSQDLEALVKDASEHDFKWKVLKFRYQEGGKVVEPFKDFKPGDLNVWAKIEKQFETGRFDYKAGFFLLAAIIEFFGQDVGTFTIVYRNLEKKLKEMIAKQIGVSKRVGESYVRKVVDTAFDEQLKKSRALLRAHFDHYDRNKSDIDSAKTKELKHRLTVLDEQRRLKKIDQEKYDEQLAKIVKEAKEYGIEDQIGYVQDATLRGYMNSPEAQWLKDLGTDVGRYGKDKALAVAKGTAITGVNALVGATKLGASLVFQGMMTPLRVAKYPLFLVAKPFAAFANHFLASPINIPGIMSTARTDFGRVGSYFGTKGSETAEGAKKKTAEAYGKSWNEAQFKRVKYGERSELNLEGEAERIKEFAGKAELKAIEIAESPSIDFAALRKEIGEADARFGGRAKLEDAHESKTVLYSRDAASPPTPANDTHTAGHEKKHETAHGGDDHGHGAHGSHEKKHAA